MGEKTKIEWADATHNFWYGCKRVSSGCRFCYAERTMRRWGKDFKKITRASGFDTPLKWKEQQFVFVNSWSDFFIEESDPWRAEAWEIIRRTPHLTYLILTKRIENAFKRLPVSFIRNPWANVWIGVSTENQKAADTRIPVLIDLPVARRFVSAEPLLGPIDFEHLIPETVHPKPGKLIHKPGIDWLICGGESGAHQKDPKRNRPMNMSWARNIRDQCVEFGIPFFFKQDWAVDPGQRPYIIEQDGTHTEWHQRPDHVVKVEQTEAPTQLSMF